MLFRLLAIALFLTAGIAAQCPLSSYPVWHSRDAKGERRAIGCVDFATGRLVLPDVDAGGLVYNASVYGSLNATLSAVGSTVGHWMEAGTGGATVFLPCGIYSESIVIPSNVSLVGQSDCSVVKATGDGVTVIKAAHESFRVRVENVVIDLGGYNNVVGLGLDSSQDGIYKNIKIVNASGATGTVGIKLYATGTTSPDDNTTLNLFEHLHVEIVPRCIHLTGNSASGGVVTLNTFTDIRCAGSGSPMIFAEAYTDHNYFTDINLSSSTATSGFTLGSTTDYDVGGFRIRNLVCDMGSSGTCLTLANTEENIIDGLRSFWTTAFSRTANTTSTTVRNILPNGPSWYEPAGFRLGQANDGTPLVMPVTAVALVNGANNDINIGTSSYVRTYGPTGAFSISGFQGGTDGRLLYLFNSASQQMTIVNNASSSTGNRILTLTGANVVLRSGTSYATFLYSAADSFWILVGYN